MPSPLIAPLTDIAQSLWANRVPVSLEKFWIQSVAVAKSSVRYVLTLFAINFDEASHIPNTADGPSMSITIRAGFSIEAIVMVAHRHKP